MKNNVKKLGFATAIFVELLVLILVSVTVFAQDTNGKQHKTGSVNWMYNYVDAITESGETGKNIFVFVNSEDQGEIGNAFEQNVLSIDVIANFINDNYIALKITTLVDGIENPDFERFDFSGYPTVMVLGSDNNVIDQIIGYVGREYLYGFLTQNAEHQRQVNVQSDKELKPDVKTLVEDGTKGSEINWIYDYDKATSISKESNKPLFVVITAPSWSDPSRKFDLEVLSNSEFASYINREFVPLKVLDSVDGLPNKYLELFNFPGYPTAIIVDGESVELCTIVGYTDKDSLKSILDSIVSKNSEFPHSEEHRTKQNDTNSPSSLDGLGTNENIDKESVSIYEIDNSRNEEQSLEYIPIIDIDSAEKIRDENRLYIDGGFAMDWVKDLYKDGNFEECATISEIIFIDGDKEALDPYMENILFLMLASYIQINDYDSALRSASEYINNYEFGKYDEYVQYLRILILYTHYNLSPSSKIVEDFILRYPDSIFMVKLMELFSKEND